MVCPSCGADLRKWDELAEEGRNRILTLPGRNGQSREHRMSNHLFCPRCDWEVHG